MPKYYVAGLWYSVCCYAADVDCFVGCSVDCLGVRYGIEGVRGVCFGFVM